MEMINQYALQLLLSRGIGDAALKKILRHVSLHPETSLESLCAHPEQLSFLIKCYADTADSVRANKAIAASLYQALQRQNIAMILENAPDYPPQLKSLLGTQCPPVLFVKGNPQLLSAPSVGFCGSRKVSEKGIALTAQCAEQLVKRNIVVVSGYAAGTDLSAHRAAMQNGGNTIFVLAEGILDFPLKQDVQALLTPENHVFVSQFAPKARWSVGNAMKRNSIIIGLSKAMILVESGKTGGTFAAGETALEIGQPLFVIDYARPGDSAEANPYFIARGGQAIRRKNTTPSLEKVFQAVEAARPAMPAQLMMDVGTM